MNTKTLMTITSLALALAGLFALFVPENLLAIANVSATNSMSVLVQLLGTLYFSFALMNWTAKDSAIGGIYARPVSLGNFGHFFTGTLILAKYLFSNPFSVFALLISIVYAVFALAFYWLVFRATGLKQ
ncbi:MAG: hypothetical protein ABI904_21665 [Chloroflexota bacterium]